MNRTTYQENTVFNSLVDSQFEDVDITSLSKTMSTVEGLFLPDERQIQLRLPCRKRLEAYLQSGIPPQIHENDIVTSCQVQTWSCNRSLTEHTSELHR